MKRLIAMTAAAALLAGPAIAQPHQWPPGNGGPPPGHGGYDHGPPPGAKHAWHNGERYEGHWERVDWRREHLRVPPPGYEWVDTGAQFVLVAVATGIITDVLLHALR